MKYAPTRVHPIQTALAATAAFVMLSAGANLPALAENLPSYATGEESIHGRILSFDGNHRVQVRDDRGYVDSVTLHDGTVINPTGLRLSAGQSVTILGRANGKTFEANEIDTPYTRAPAAVAVPVVPYVYPVPAYGYYASYAYAAPYPYFAYGYPYRYYDARIALRFGYRGGFAIGGRF
jgi:hypothetical protein